MTPLSQRVASFVARSCCNSFSCGRCSLAAVVVVVVSAVLYNVTGSSLPRFLRL